MNSERDEELVAYSVQDLGGLWRWRVYRAHGQVIRQGVEATADRAERAAAALVFGFATSPAAQSGAPASPPPPARPPSAQLANALLSR